MGMPIEGQVGPVSVQDGSKATFRMGRQGEGIVGELHGRFYEQTFRGNVFSGGMTVTAINNATFTTGTLTASCTPIAGVWNPGTSEKNLVILQATLAVVLTALQNTGGGPFVWATSTGNNVISTGNVPLNRKTLAKSGSVAKDMSGLALTGLTNNLVVACASACGGGNLFAIATLDTAAGFSTTLQPTVENIDGAWIVPPGGVLALLATTTPVAHSAAASLVWEEVPVTA